MDSEEGGHQAQRQRRRIGSTPEEQYQTGLDRAYGLTAKYSYTEQQIREKLLQRGYEEGVVERVVARLVELVGGVRVCVCVCVCARARACTYV